MNDPGKDNQMNDRVSTSSSPEFPLVSIITVVYNHKSSLERTIQNVRSQSYPNIEYIIIDGGSTDGTLDIIKQYSDDIAFWISEPDKGLYDAMNKGINQAHGDYIWFINAGDLIYSSDTISKVLATSAGADVYYGNTIIIDIDGHVIGMRRLKPPRKMTWKSLRLGMVVCHQAVIVKRELVTPFNTKYRYASDYDWVLKILRKSKRIVNTNMILAKYMKGGYSSKYIKQSLRERFEVMKINYGLIPTLMCHVVIAFRFLFFYLVHGWF